MAMYTLRVTYSDYTGIKTRDFYCDWYCIGSQMSGCGIELHRIVKIEQIPVHVG